MLGGCGKEGGDALAFIVKIVPAVAERGEETKTRRSCNS